MCAAGAALVLLGLLTNAWLRAHPGRWGPRLTGAGITLFVAYQTDTMHELVSGNARHATNIEQAFAWVRAQPPGPVLIGMNETAPR